MFSTTGSTAIRRTAARIAVIAALTAIPVAAAVPAMAEPASPAPAVTDIHHPRHHDRNRHDHDRDRDWNRGRDRDWDRGWHDNDPGRWPRHVLPRGLFGSS